MFLEYKFMKKKTTFLKRFRPQFRWKFNDMWEFWWHLGNRKIAWFFLHVFRFFPTQLYTQNQKFITSAKSCLIFLFNLNINRNKKASYKFGTCQDFF